MMLAQRKLVMDEFEVMCPMKWTETFEMFPKGVKKWTPRYNCPIHCTVGPIDGDGIH